MDVGSHDDNVDMGNGNKTEHGRRRVRDEKLQHEREGQRVVVCGRFVRKVF
jgi:hypothetical protein